ncbi:hypothetical protein A8F94_14780 [Bacillus sp. FJAT-27225]|uniref:DUF3139 domain-containing protein n=1 Tax=Bacillus sp. FJAT-27225 TaxID=1743144 RepID=UPI00080C29A7|nr:DUF3139 domain-containing protein [Bacillus sp. FJAT-27225]OCA83999.1 hypothetical protein A8F94_14780 [Bacillus sp. FJAT-27225]
MSDKTVVTLNFVLLFILGFLLYTFPIQKYLSEKDVAEYMKKQGISKENIKSKEVKKDYKQGGYYVNVELKDDPGVIYEYIWYIDGEILLIGYKNDSSLEDEELKHPPIE